MNNLHSPPRHRAHLCVRGGECVTRLGFAIFGSMLTAALWFAPHQAHAQAGVQTIYSAHGGSDLILGSDGRLYGVLKVGPTNYMGRLFALNKNGSGYSVLRDFTGTDGDGASPTSVTEGSDYVLYGTTHYGGTNHYGTVFKINRDGTGYVVLHRFLGGLADGWSSLAGVVEASDGRLYGTTEYGGAYGNGTVYSLDKNGSSYQLLHSFVGVVAGDGAEPVAALIEGSDLALYGTTRKGGTSDQGTVFKLNKDGSGYAVLRHFISGDLENPATSLTEGSDGALYGTVMDGGSATGSGAGGLFRLNKDGSDFRVLRRFPYGGGDGEYPNAPLVETSDGRLYGMTTEGGAFDSGIIYTLNRDGSSYVALHDFTGSDGYSDNPSRLLRAPDGAFYGINKEGVFRMPVWIIQPPISQTAGSGRSAAFAVTALGVPTLSYQWRFKGGMIPGATEPHYDIPFVTPDSAGDYSVTVYSTYGAVTSSPATLTVLTAPVITSQPIDRLVSQYQSTSFAVTANGDLLQYQWRKNGNSITGAVSALYSIISAQPTDAGTYSVLVSNPAGSVASSNVGLTVLTNADPSTNWVLSLDGVERYATVPDSAALRLTNGDFSIMTWVWMNDTNFGAILAKRVTGSHQGWMLYIAGANQGMETGKPAFVVSGGADPRVYGNTEIGTNRWRHIAVVYHSANSNAMLYIDGALAGANTVPPPLPNSSPLYIGRDSQVAQYLLNGNVDEVSIWSRALTPDEISWRKSCRLSGAEPNLVAYWHFDTGTIADVSGHGHNGAGVPDSNVPVVFDNNNLHLGCVAARVTVWTQSAGGLPRFGFVGASSLQYRIDASSNLFDWIPLFVLPASDTNVVEFVDPMAASLPTRFYRAVFQ